MFAEDCSSTWLAFQQLSPPPLAWVDLGCGRGEWLGMAAEAGYPITGVDRNQFAIELCRSRGLPVVQADALEYLQSLQDETCGVVTAFHLLENCELGYILETFRGVSRVLARAVRSLWRR